MKQFLINLPAHQMPWHIGSPSSNLGLATASAGPAPPTRILPVDPKQSFFTEGMTRQQSGESYVARLTGRSLCHGCWLLESAGGCAKACLAHLLCRHAMFLHNWRTPSLSLFFCGAIAAYKTAGILGVICPMHCHWQGSWTLTSLLHRFQSDRQSERRTSAPEGSSQSPRHLQPCPLWPSHGQWHEPMFEEP